MKISDDWHIVLKKAWSVRFMALAAVFAGLEAAMPYLQGYLPVSPETFGALSGLSTAAALFSRFIAQEGVEESGKQEKSTDG